MNATKIEWVRNPDGNPGYTFNPITGCLNHTPEGLCLGGMFPCYAYKLANGRLRSRYLANDRLVPVNEQYLIGFNTKYKPENDPFYPRFWPERIDKFFLRKKPAGIFLCDMGELFGDWLPDYWQHEIFHAIKLCPQHRFYLLTKQPQNLIKFSPFPDNCWCGVTCTNALMLQKALPELYRITAKVKFISFEPLLSAIWEDQLADGFELLDWVIIGAQTKPYKPPKIEWVEEIVRACVKAGISVFLKDNLLSMDLPYDDIFFPYECPGSRHLRQEIPR